MPDKMAELPRVNLVHSGKALGGRVASENCERLLRTDDGGVEAKGDGAVLWIIWLCWEGAGAGWWWNLFFLSL